MDTLRIALILGGLLLLALLILWDRARRRRNEQRRRAEQELAELDGASGRDTDSELLDGEWSVGPVRVNGGVDEAIETVSAMGGLNSAREEDGDVLFDKPMTAEPAPVAEAPVEPAPSVALEPLEESEPEPAPIVEPAVEPVEKAAPEAPSESKAEPESEADDTEAQHAEEEGGHTLILTLLAAEGKRLHGPALLRAIEAQGMRVGDEGLFHRYIDELPLYSMANILEPGHFELNKMQLFTTPGVLLFLQLPGPLGAERAVNEFFAGARALANTLDARLADQARQPIDEAGLEAMRDKLLG